MSAMDNFTQNNQPNNQQHFDVIISGGGLSGSLMALSLSQLTKADGSLLSIAIVEALPFKETSPADDIALFDARVLALSHGSAKYLDKLGAWQYLKNDACAITDIDISDRGHFAKARLTAKEHGVNALGYVIDMALIGKAQLKALNQNTKNNIQWFSPDSITEIVWRGNLGDNNKETASPKNQQVNVKLKSGKLLSTQLLLGCDGIQSPVRKHANIEIISDDYGQVALIANVSTSKAHHHKAFERFSEFGPIAMLPLKSINSNSSKDGSSRCSLVWTMTPEQAQRIKELDDDAFKEVLEREFGSYLGAITQVGKRDTYPLVLMQAQRQIYHRMALIGNASHTIHPIAGQGFNLGLRDVEVMAELIEGALAAEQDIGHFSLLHAYQANRTKDQNEIIKLTDSLVTLFANNLPPLVVGRNLALQALNVISPLKKALVKKTMGY